MGANEHEWSGGDAGWRGLPRVACAVRLRLVVDAYNAERAGIW